MTSANIFPKVDGDIFNGADANWILRPLSVLGSADNMPVSGGSTTTWNTAKRYQTIGPGSITQYVVIRWNVKATAACGINNGNSASNTAWSRLGYGPGSYLFSGTNCIATTSFLEGGGMNMGQAGRAPFAMHAWKWIPTTAEKASGLDIYLDLWAQCVGDGSSGNWIYNDYWEVWGT